MNEPRRKHWLVRANIRVAITSLVLPILVVALDRLDRSDTRFHGLLQGHDDLLIAMILLAFSLLLLVLVLLPFSGWQIWRRQVDAGQLASACAISFITLLIFNNVVITSVLVTDKHQHITADSRLRTLNIALANYVSTYSQGFPDTLDKLGEPPAGQQPDANNAGFLSDLGAGRKGGGSATSFVWNRYQFTYTPGPRNIQGHIATYIIAARPKNTWPDQRSTSFVTDHSQAIHFTNEDRDATLQDPPLN